MKKTTHPPPHSPTEMSHQFLITIYHQENHSWQGVIQWLDTGKKIHFRSELELMTLIHSATLRNASKNDSFRTWHEDHGLKSVK